LINKILEKVFYQEIVNFRCYKVEYLITIQLKNLRQFNKKLSIILNFYTKNNLLVSLIDEKDNNGLIQENKEYNII
jgi:hypothetical protein